MGGRRWHVEHADGREWTRDELDGLAARLRESHRIAPYDETCYAVCIDGRGRLWMLGDSFGSYYHIDDPDCVVVWDD